MAGTFAEHLTLRELAQLFVNERNQPVESRWITSAPAEQEIRNVICRRCRHRTVTEAVRPSHRGAQITTSSMTPIPILLPEKKDF
jgi:hypothetical protein